MISYNSVILLFVLIVNSGYFKAEQTLITGPNGTMITENRMFILGKSIMPPLERSKGAAGKIGVIGGSIEYTGAPYFAAMAALKIGADLVYVITTRNAAPVIKSYSPDLIVYPFFHKKYLHKVKLMLPKMDVIVVGPGLGREQGTLDLIYDIIETCNILKKPLIVDDDALYAISINVSAIYNYSSPGAILTPNKREVNELIQAVSSISTGCEWYNYWGNHVSIIVKGEVDTYYTNNTNYQWASSGKGSGRRVGGQGNILAGFLATLYNWALKSELYTDKECQSLAKSVAVFVATQLTRKCNFEAFKTYGRSMLASDMLKEIHVVLDQIFDYEIFLT